MTTASRFAADRPTVGGWTTLTPDDLTHLRRCVDLAREALDAGDEPFGSLLVDPDGVVLREDRNRTADGDQTRHPELELARWAAEHVAEDVRPSCTVYTSGEHCPMCSAAHAWVGLGRIVYAASTAQLSEWRAGWGLPAGTGARRCRSTRSRRACLLRARHPSSPTSSGSCTGELLGSTASAVPVVRQTHHRHRTRRRPRLAW